MESSYSSIASRTRSRILVERETPSLFAHFRRLAKRGFSKTTLTLGFEVGIFYVYQKCNTLSRLATNRLAIKYTGEGVAFDLLNLAEAADETFFPALELRTQKLLNQFAGKFGVNHTRS